MSKKKSGVTTTHVIEVRRVCGLSVGRLVDFEFVSDDGVLLGRDGVLQGRGTGQGTNRGAVVVVPSLHHHPVGSIAKHAVLDRGI